MIDKLRKRIGSAPWLLVMSAVAVLGAVIVLSSVAGQGTAQAQDDGLPPDPFAPSTAPGAPSNVVATAGSASLVTVTWTASSDAPADTEYEIQRKTGSGNYAGLDPAHSGTAAIYVDGNVSASTSYTYRVRATTDDEGVSEWAESNEVTTPAAPPPPPTQEPNNKPTAVGEIGNLSIAPDGTDTVDVASAFSDTDGDALTYTATSDMEMYATVSVSGSTVTVTGVADGTATITVTATDPDGATATQSFTVTVATPEMPSVASSSTSASATVRLTLTIPDLPMDLQGGSSIVVYLEDQFKVPASIGRDTVYFTAEGGSPADDASTSNGRRIYATDPIEIETDAHFTNDKKDWDIQVLIPDMNTSDVDQYSNFDGPKAGQTLTLVFTKSAGIKNDSEAGTHSVGYDILGPNDNPGKLDRDSMSNLDNVEGSGSPLATLAKITLSDVDNSRGYEMTVTGSGFNDGTSAAVHVLHDPSIGGVPSGDAEAALCARIIREGQRAGIATVGSDDKVAVTFEVTVPTFGPGNHNYICMVDGEGRAASTDVEDFNLQPSIRVVPSSANAGDSVTVFAQDYTSGNFEQLLIAGQDVTSIVSDRSSIGTDGSATATFELPGSVGGSALEGTVRIDATWGGVKEDTKITITGSQLNLSKAEALPNELITISGDGFGGDYIDVAKITIDGAALMVDSDSMHRMGAMNVVDVSNAGQFVASVVLWPASVSGSNPSLIAGTHTIDVEDNAGFSGSAVILIPEPSISVTPAVAGPRDVITVTGENWPIDNVDGAAPPAVDIKISDGARTRRYSAFADSAGRFTIEHRVASDVAIPSTNQVRAEMDTDIVKVGSFEVPAAIINIEPAEGQPGDHITLSVDGMPVYQQVDRVEIGGRSVLPVGNFSTDSSGSVTVTDVLIPGLDPGTYSVLLDVEDTIAIGELNVLAETAAAGPAAMLPDAVEALGDNLVAVFHFDDVGKTWSFYDPRPDFADLNTLSELVSGEAYWILVSETVEDVVLNNRARSLTCRGDDCWNLEVW